MKDQFCKMRFDKIYTDSFLPKPMTPSKWLGISYKPVTRIKMSCGGGMGGSSWYEYVERVPLDSIAAEEKRCIVFRTFDGENVLLNIAYMVKAEQFTVAMATLRSENPYFPKGDYTYCFLVEDGHELVLSDESRPVI